MPTSYDINKTYQQDQDWISGPTSWADTNFPHQKHILNWVANRNQNNHNKETNGFDSSVLFTDYRL